MIHAVFALSVLSARCAPVVYAPAGVYRSDGATGGPGLVLSGAGLSSMPTVTVLRWIRAHAVGTAGARAGNLVILKASGERDYSDQFFRSSSLRSIQEILIPPCASRAQVDRVAPLVDRATAVLFAGGDQSHYVVWKNSRLMEAVKRVYTRGGVVGGGSAGLAIQGQVVFDSAAADRVLPDDEDVATPDAVKNPYEPAISFTTGLFSWPPLNGAITDTHFARRNRFGRLGAFMARALRDGLVRGDRIYGVAVDEGSVLLVNSQGVATLVQTPRKAGGYVPKGAYILEGGHAGRIVPGQPLRYTVSVIHLRSSGAQFNLVTHVGQGNRYKVTIDGASHAVYSRIPY